MTRQIGFADFILFQTSLAELLPFKATMSHSPKSNGFLRYFNKKYRLACPYRDDVSCLSVYHRSSITIKKLTSDIGWLSISANREKGGPSSLAWRVVTAKLLMSNGYINSQFLESGLKITFWDAKKWKSSRMWDAGVVVVFKTTARSSPWESRTKLKLRQAVEVKKIQVSG